MPVFLQSVWTLIVFDTMVVFLKVFFIKLIRKKHREKLPSMQCVKLSFFSAAKLSDSGMYTCTLVDEHGDEMSSKSFRVTVLSTSK